MSHATTPEPLPAAPASSFDRFVERHKADGSLHNAYWHAEAIQAAQAAEAAEAAAQRGERPGPPRAAGPGPARRPHRTPEGPEAGPTSLRGLSFTVRAVLQLAPDLDIPTPELVYTALWAPVVAQDMQMRDSEVALLSRERLSEATGMKGQSVMAPGGTAERAEACVGIVRLVRRGVPGAVPRQDGEDWRGEASSWTVTRPLAGFTHLPGRIGEPLRAVPEERPLLDAEVDPEAMNVWLHPLHPWWGPNSAGLTGMRTVAALITRYGMDDVLLSAADVAAMLGVHRRTAWRTLAALSRLGLACPEGKRGRWRVRLRSHLGRLFYDDVKYDQRRPPPPSRARARVHDWGWFTREGRAVRARARTVMASQETCQAWTWDFPGDPEQIDVRTGRPRGMFMWVVEALRRYISVGQQAARGILARRADRAATDERPGLPGPQQGAQGLSWPLGEPGVSAPGVPPEAADPDPAVPDPAGSPGAAARQTTAEMIAELRRRPPVWVAE